LIDVDDTNATKDIQQLDIAIPILTMSLWRDVKEIASLEPDRYLTQSLKLKYYPDQELQSFVFVNVFD
jgi:hypothetical protein